MRSGKIFPEWNIKVVIPASIRKHLNNNIWWLFLSIIPGLGHSAQGRFKEIRLYFWGWLVLFLAGLFFYGSSVGFILLGLAIGLHACIALQSGIIRDFDSLNGKIRVSVFVLLILAFIYWFTPRAFLVGGPAGLTIPYHNIEAGDYLFGWHHFDRTVPLPRGTLVLIYPARLFAGHPNNVRGMRSHVAVFAEVVGIAGEKLQIDDDTFIIDGQKLDMEKYPVPQWLRNRNISAIIPEGSYFLNVLYDVRDHGVGVNSSVILRACLVKRGDIEAKAFLCWWPLSRRGFIKVD
jgi:type IV secretory pathway protease TraF